MDTATVSFETFSVIIVMAKGKLIVTLAASQCHFPATSDSFAVLLQLVLAFVLLARHSGRIWTQFLSWCEAAGLSFFGMEVSERVSEFHAGFEFVV